MDSDEHARSTCGMRDLRQPPVRRWVWQWAVAARRPTSMVCWWQSGDAGGARGSAPRAGDDGPPRSSVRPTRHSPPHGDIDDADVAAAAAGRAARFSYRVVENRRHRTISSLGGPANRHISSILLNFLLSRGRENLLHVETERHKPLTNDSLFSAHERRYRRNRTRSFRLDISRCS